jgi:4-hydroxy-tetrahydrodipicolinate synthase
MHMSTVPSAASPVFAPGLVHTPFTPFASDGGIDFERYGRLVEFHLREGADSIAVPMHAGESVSLPLAKRHRVLEFVLERVAGRVPVIAHVSESGTSMAADLARHAQQAGATAIVANVPYYWTPPQPMLVEHFAQIAAAVRLPMFVHNFPEEMGGVKFNAASAIELIERSPNFIGLVDSSLDWQYMIELLMLSRRVRPSFALLSGSEYLISAHAIGATGSFCALAGIAPKAVRRLHELCMAERYEAARPVQDAIAALRMAIKPGGVAALKAASQAMGRDCGSVQPPLSPLSEADGARLSLALSKIEMLGDEPRGW